MWQLHECLFSVTDETQYPVPRPGRFTPSITAAVIIQPFNEEKSNSTFTSRAPLFLKEHCFLEGYQTTPVCLQVRATCGWIWVLNIGGMILTCASTTLSTTITTWTGQGSNPGLHGERPATNRLRHDMTPFKNENYSEWHLKIQFVLHSKHYSVIKSSKVTQCKEIVAISSEIHTKQKAEFVRFKLM